MQPVHIAPAVDADYDWCARLMASSEPWITLKRDLQGCFAVLSRPGAELFVARSQSAGEPLGFILLAPQGMAGSPYIASIGVAPAARGQNIGAQLIAFTERHFRGRSHLFLLVSSFNPRAQKFYRAHGFEFIAELKDYIVPGHSELIFHKRIS